MLSVFDISQKAGQRYLNIKERDGYLAFSAA